MALRETVDFLLHDWLRVAELAARARFADHSRETFDAVLTPARALPAGKSRPSTGRWTTRSRASTASG